MNPLYYDIFILLLLNSVEANIDSQCYDNSINIKDVIRNLTACGSMDTYQENFEAMDVNHDGNVTFEDFHDKCFKRFQELLFCNYDDNMDGILNVDEFTIGEERRMTSEDSMEKIDTNSDHLISESELIQLLNNANVDYSNVNLLTFPLSYTEFAGFLRQIPNDTFPCRPNAICPSAKESFATTFSGIDYNNDGKITFEDFTSSFYMVSLENEVFSKMDLDGDGLISYEDWTTRLNPEIYKYSFEVNYFNRLDVDGDGRWNKAELSSYLIEHELENRNAWYILYSNKGPLTMTKAREFGEKIPNRNFRIIVETDEEVLNENYVKGIPHDKRVPQ